MLTFDRVEPGFYEVRHDGSLKAYIQRYQSIEDAQGWLLYTDEKQLADVRTFADAKIAASAKIN